MKTIQTTYHGPTDTRGARIYATDCGDHRISIPYPHELSDEAVHRKAADALCAKLGWTGHMVSGQTKTGYVFVFAPDCDALRAALKRAIPWLGRMIADGGHLNSILPNDCVGALDQAEAAIKVS